MGLDARSPGVLMAPDRFDRLEGPSELPGPVRDAVSRLDRFEHLEIAPAGPDPAGTAACRPPGGGSPAPRKRLCHRCGQANEPERTTCWACFKPLDAPKAAGKSAPPDDITVVIDGATYRSSDPNLPDDVAELIRRIRAHGYSPELLAQWRSWRVTRHEAPLPQRPFEPGPAAQSDDVNVFRGQRVNVIRIDGRVFTSDDPNAPPELKELFGYIDRNGVTPALMDLLRQYGRAKYRPATTAAPSDGDLAFWREVNAAGGQSSAPPPAPGPLRDARARDVALAVAAALFLLLRLIIG